MESIEGKKEEEEESRERKKEKANRMSTRLRGNSDYSSAAL